MSEERARQEAEQLRKDVNVAALYKFLLVLGLVCVAVLVAAWAAFVYLNHESKAEDPQLSPLAVRPDQPPPEPRLQVNEPADLQTILNAEDKMLHSYAWVDKNKRIVRIPIQDAMKIVAQRKELQKAAPAPPVPQTQTAPGAVQQ